ncbi:MAG TPA: ABC transporter permease subunit [Micromonosporaceae bacterium]|jgi:multiple sugar transport system permease protein|nr:ABC transporter permease subunit [Micromonosporaceae bacterium]
MRNLRRAEPLLWLGPTLLLIAAVIVYPAYEMVRTSFLDVSSIGFAHGYKGLDNYQDLFGEDALSSVVGNTVLWVVVVVGVTIVVSLAMAQFLNKRFAGRRLVRWALIVPWAASLVMTSTVWRYIYELDYGPLNRLLMDLGVIATPVDWYKDSATAFWCLVFVGIVVSIPFTTYVFLAGLQTIPTDVYEAAAIDGARPVQTYWWVTFPMLRPQLVVAIVLNTIYVFNSFPIIWVITGKIPGNETDTATTYMYKLAFRSSAGADEAAALGVINVIFLMAVVLFYVRRTEFGDAGEASVRQTGGSARAAGFTDVVLSVGRALGSVMAPAGRGLTVIWRPVRRFGLPVIGLVTAVFFLAPYAVMLIGSLKSTRELAASPATYLPDRPAWANFVDVWSKIPLWDYLRASLAIALIATAVVLLVATPAAYFTSRHQFRGRRLFLTIVLVTQMFAPVALVVGLYREFVVADAVLKQADPGWGAINTYWSIILINSAFNLAFAIWILNGYFASIPKDIEEAAMIDGLGRLRAMLSVVLPLAKPGIVTAVIFTFIQVWNEFVVALTLFNDPTRNRMTLTVGINQFVGQYDVNYQYLFIVSLIGIVPVVVLFAVIERYLVAGLTAGSVK